MSLMSCEKFQIISSLFINSTFCENVFFSEKSEIIISKSSFLNMKSLLDSLINSFSDNYTFIEVTISDFFPSVAAYSNTTLFIYSCKFKSSEIIYEDTSSLFWSISSPDYFVVYNSTFLFLSSYTNGGVIFFSSS